MRTFAAAILAAAHVTAAIQAPIEGYGVVEMQWEIEVAPGRIEILNGTIQEAHREAKMINPAFSPALPSPAPVGARSPARPPLDRRSDVRCETFPTGSYSSLYRQTQEYLRNVPGRPSNGPGPGNCGRVSCDKGSGIWWCNDNAAPLTISSYDALANSALYTLQQCNHMNDDTQNGVLLNRVSGQNFEQGGWNTIVRGDEENC